MATNSGNLPSLIKYNKIKDVTIFKLPGSMKSGSFNSAYGIKLTEIFEKEVVKKHWIFKKTEIETKEVERIIPFSFKSLEVAKDFAQYIPGMQIWGERFYYTIDNKTNINDQLIYETYLIKVPSIREILAIKFIDECCHATHRDYKRKETEDGKGWHEYYINDLDKKYFDGSPGHWYDYSDLIVNCFFTTYDFDIETKNIITRDKFETLGDRQKFENETTHHFILMEQ